MTPKQLSASTLFYISRVHKWTINDNDNLQFISTQKANVELPSSVACMWLDSGSKPENHRETMKNRKNVEQSPSREMTM